MSNKIYGDISASGNIQVSGQNTIRDVNGFLADTDGNMDIPYYTKYYLDNLVSMMPVSRVGTLDYLPMNITGSYEGATTLYDKYIIPVILEDDGTMVYLRPGTNGSSKGYYYCYVENARDSTTYYPTLTNVTYVPSFFTSSHTLVDFVGTKGDEMLFMRTNNGTYNTYTIAITNGTFNQISHQYTEFNRSLMPNGDPQYAHIVGDLIYIWCMGSYIYSNPFELYLYTIKVSDVINGISSSLVNVAGFNGKDLYGTAVNSSSTIKIANKYSSKVASDNPFMLEDSSASASVLHLNHDGVIQAAGSTDKKKIRVALFHPFYIGAPYGGSSQQMWGLSFSYDISTKQYTYDNNTSGAIKTFADSGTIQITNPYATKMENINGFVTSAQGNSPTLLTTNDGKVFSTIARFITSDNHRISRCTIDNWVDPYTNLNLITRTASNYTNKYVSPIFGSAIGGSLLNPTVISPNKVLLNCSGTQNNVTFGFDNKVYTDIGTSRNYVYKSAANGGTINGYAPQVNRKMITNTNNKYNALITLINTDGTTKVYGSSFIEGYSKPQTGLMNPNTMEFGSSYTLSSDTLLTSLKTQVLNAVSYPGTIIDSKIVFYYVPDSNFGNSVAITTIICSQKNDSGYNTFVVVSKVNTTQSGYNISALNSVYNSIMGVHSGGLSIDYSYIARMTGLVIAKYSGFSYIGIPAVVNVALSGNASFRSVVGKLDTNYNITNMRAFDSYFVSGANNRFEVGAIPNVGFGLFDDGAVTDYQTKLVFKNFGTTSAQLDKLIADPSSAGIENIVIAAQDVAQGFIVYYTQPIPVLLNGKVYSIPSTYIDLNSIDSSPANKTFYLYVVNTEGTPQHVISSTLLSEELYRIYIGKVVTNSTGIASIETEKVTRFLTYRTSVTKCGSAIPSSTGVPSAPGTRWK